jgi:hypothetical protein
MEVAEIGRPEVVGAEVVEGSAATPEMVGQPLGEDIEGYLSDVEVDGAVEFKIIL